MDARTLWRHRLLPVLAFPGLILAGFLLEKLYLEPLAAQRSPEERIAFWREHAERHPGFALSQIRLAQLHARQERWEEAGRIYERVLEEHPDSETAAVGLNDVLRATRGLPAAIEQMERFLEANPGCGVCARNLAAEYLALGEVEEALGYVDTVVANAGYALPSHYTSFDTGSGAFVLAGRIHAAAGHRERARELFRKALDRSPGSAQAVFQLARLDARSDPEAARARWERYRELRPGDLRSFVVEARTLAEAGHLDAAGTALLEARGEASRLAPARAARWRDELDFQSAWLRYRRGDADSAARELRALLRRRPGFERARELLAELPGGATGSS